MMYLAVLNFTQPKVHRSHEANAGAELSESHPPKVGCHMPSCLLDSTRGRIIHVGMFARAGSVA